MAVLFEDTFNGAGSLSGRSPDFGPAWNGGARGVVSGGVLNSVWQAGFGDGTHAIYGSFNLKLNADVLSFHLSYYIDGARNAWAGFAFEFNPELDIASVNYEGGTTALRAFGQGAYADVAALSRPGSNELVQTINYLTGQSTLYVNGVIAYSGPYDTYGEGGSWKPNPSSNTRINLAGGGSIGDGLPMQLQITGFRITDEVYAPDVGEFWTNMIRTAEAP